MAPHLEIVTLLGAKETKAIDLVREIKINKRINPDFVPDEDSYLLIRDVVEIYDLVIIELWKFAFDKSSENHEYKNSFHQYCKECFYLLQVLPIPDEPILKIRHVLKLLTYSYLGEKWEDMRRIIIKDRAVLELDSDSPDWDVRLFSTIYLAILHMTKKEKWDDLSETSRLIVKLRSEQKMFEKTYLDGRQDKFKVGAAYELMSLYHLAKSVELVGKYMLQGTPSQINVMLDMNFEKAISYCEQGRQSELYLILRMLQLTFRKMIENSVWSVANRVNSRVKTFTKQITESSKPIFELMYPQRITILEKGLLDPANKAIVVTLPTSSGKTMIAEFRILQALNQFSGQKVWIAYVAPTRSLVNQITNRLRRDLGRDPLNIRVEKMSGAVDTGTFEESLLGEDNAFDILVTTPEKLNLLTRQGTQNGFNNSLVLAVIDEAHNLGDRNRGLNLEMLISTIKNDCENANLLLLTPFLPNSEELSQWLDPQNPKSIGIELAWQPNDSSIGLCYATGNRRNVATHYMPLLYPPRVVETPKEITLDEISECDFTIGEIKNAKYRATSLVAKTLIKRGNVLILGGTIDNTWKIADTLSKLLPKIEQLDKSIKLVQRFISAELGEDFPLVTHLSHGIGVHNAGLPDEIKQLMEWLMENNLLQILVATTTIAQGMNFPVSSILLSTYSYPRIGEMPTRDFMNLAGRVGRIDQQGMGIVGITVDGSETPKALQAMRFVKKSIENVISVLVQLVDESLTNGNVLNLKTLYHQPEWSNFLGYLAHMYNQSENLQGFISHVEITLRNTYGYLQLEPPKKSILLEAVTEYASELDSNRNNSSLSDTTGFSPETIKATIKKVESLEIGQSDWDSSRLFSGSSETLTKLMRVMLEDIPEIKKGLSDIKTTGTELTHSSLGKIVSDWVSGKELTEISEAYFGGSDINSMKNCVSAIYGKISNLATWGLSGIQKMSPNLDLKALSEDERKKLQNLSAMVYYGVNSDEAILMRMNNVPRSIADSVGKLYLDEHDPAKLYESRSSSVIKWLNGMSEEQWNSAIPKYKGIAGSEYKQIWKRISGME